MNPRRSLALRAVLALVLMAAFFALAVATVVGLCWLGIETGQLLGEIRVGKVTLVVAIFAGACFVAAGVVAWSVLPRIDRFVPPGPELARKDSRELFREIDAIAAATGQRPPAHVYLVGDVNAFVTERGGIMGLGSRRVMGVGLPLLQLLTVTELRAVLTHEFGHYHGGDTKLGPWIYKTRGAIGRTVVNLARTGGAAESDDGYLAVFGFVLAAIRKPFHWFGLAYLRITQAISRAQEFSADALAVRLVGSAPMIAGLQKVHGGSVAYGSYRRGELDPVLDAGFRPPIAAGFARFLAAPAMSQLVERVVEGELASDEADPYDSHPPLRERVAAATALAGPTRAPDGRCAVELFPDLAAVEARLLAFAAPEASLRPIEWGEALRAVHEPSWRAQARSVAGRNGALTPASIPTRMGDLCAVLARQIGDQACDRLADEDVLEWAIGSFGCVLTVLLIDRGVVVTAEVGEAVVARSGEASLEPFNDVRRYLKGELSAEAWRERLEPFDVADVAFAELVAGAVAA